MTPGQAIRFAHAGSRKHREDAGFNRSQLARKLGWSQSRVSRLESGKRGVSELDIAVFLAVCGVAGKKMDELIPDQLCTGLISRDRAETQVKARIARQSVMNRRSPPELFVRLANDHDVLEDEYEFP